MKKRLKEREILEKKMRKEKLCESFFMIITMILSTFAIAFLISAASETVKAADETTPAYTVCCEKTKSGAFCQNALQADCDSSLRINPTNCDSTSYCKLGCCYDSSEGTCSENTPELVCKQKAGTYDSSSATCEIPQCSLGCCVLGGEASLVTLTRCKKLASYYGLQVDFRSNIKSETECIDIANAQDTGACVFTRDNEKTCRFVTRGECKGIGNETTFHKDFLCSAEELGTNCAKQHHTGCVTGKEEVYWFDSCGNPENIYDADKVKSWNSGQTLTKEKSCGAGTGNIESKTCGNCQYPLGSMCGKAKTGELSPAYGDYICRDLNCKNTYDGTNRKNGESWCVYDGIVGNGTDVAGSRQWRHLCIAGEEKLEPCADLRQEICIQGTADTTAGKFTEAVCRTNRWRECLDISSTMSTELTSAATTGASTTDIKEKYKLKCGNISDCYWAEVWEGKIPLCLPSFPTGLNLATESGGASATSVCAQASASCKIIEVKELTGWKCKENCECKTEAWTQDMNKFCTSLGDCGAKANIIGKVTTDGYTVTGDSAVKLSKTYLQKLASYATGKMPASVTGKVTGAAVTETGEQISVGSTVSGTTTDNQPFTGKVEQILDTNGVKYAIIAALGTKISLPLSELKLSGIMPKTSWVAGINTKLNSLAGKIGEKFGLSNSASQIAGAAVSAYFIAKMFGLDSTSSAIVAAVAGYAASAYPVSMTGGKLFGTQGFAAGLVAAIIIIIILKLLGIGKKREKTVTFTCMPWQAPSGGNDCEKCNKDSMKPCSDYRCSSLGASCSLLNPGSGNETCVWLNKDDTLSPSITPWRDVLTKNHEYVSVTPCPPGPGCWTINGPGKGGCIKAFTPLEWGVVTNEAAQCKIDYNHTAKYDDMQFYFGETSLHLYNHSIRMSLPGPTQITSAAAAGGSPEIKNNGNYSLFIRCKDGNGNANLQEMAVSFCVEAGPDTTPPEILRTSLENGAPIAYGAKSTPLEIYVNEPSQCKWSRTDQAYEDMKTSFNCATDIQSFESDLTYKCSTTLTDVADNRENTYYFRCKDQPWLAGINESDRNVNKQSYVFKLQGTQSLNITSVGPNGTIYGGFEPFVITLKAETANGADAGKAKCSYSESGYASMIEFFTTGTSEHEQRLDLKEGHYNYFIECRDTAGNIDRNKTSFTLIIDKTSPQIARAYKDGDVLKLITAEDSECAYDIKSCSFDFTTATQMPFANSTEHTALWRTDVDYYVKCRDAYGNLPTGCSMVVRAYDFTGEQGLA